ncbi:MAG TPA: FIST N-terminal domain-containing protein [Miltoncostaeaceae bacterium]|nr:FIST N-terminal domain-containing protein [Miltoncostaeaceae bacterium]
MDTGSTISSALALGDDPAEVAGRAAREVRGRLGGDADLVVMFASPVLCRDPGAILDAVHAELRPRRLVGCTGEAIIGTGREVEGDPALVVWAARLPGARITPVRTAAEADETGEATFPGWPFLPGVATGEGAQAPDADDAVILLADPFSFPVDRFLAAVADNVWRPPIVGGLASGGRAPGQHVLFLDRRWYDDGAVGVTVGGTDMVIAVSQGCAPIGPEMVVTDAEEGGLVYELAGRPAIAKLEEVIGGLEPPERKLALNGLLAGLVIDENRPEYVRGDFLVRGILGGDRETGALVVGERVRVGQTMRLHVRDADSADEDLRETLRGARAQLAGTPAGALVFTCNGRGTHMFPVPDHDASVLGEELGNAPAAGLFCNGEIGPVGGRTFAHGFTATMALFGATPQPDGTPAD